ncbi:rod shape-determining protein MreD [Ferroacidibacillus organovorans]|uniref:Rod shape-determining protein MreD n=1 Tax=Ferroacidibacillus organovorans TaxID=1765683 RepID=A0A1V4EU08_9BACL|nr:rod shape-determining protein MreD [Ferroacidibacillus organovorans]OPG16427.1 rod shape-determining protein MreD [Ferroacidibacillus organovorans]
MRSTLLFVALFLSLVLESTVFRAPILSEYAPNLVVIGLVMTGLLRTPRMGLLFGLGIGLIQDIDYGRFLGETAFAYALIGYLAGYFRHLVLRESALLAILVTGLASELFAWVTYGEARLLEASGTTLHEVIRSSSKTSLVSMVVVLLLYAPYRKAFLKKKKVSYNDATADGAS